MKKLIRIVLTITMIAQYRWYRRYVYRTAIGAVVKDTAVNQKIIIGVPNSPENPLACRAYGF